MKFIHKRKENIRKKLKEFDMTQQDLVIILGHPKLYMSELINGVSPFTPLYTKKNGRRVLNFPKLYPI